MNGPSQDLVPIAIQGIPLAVWDRARSWFEGLIREFDIIASAQSDDSTPRRLLDFIDETRPRFARFGTSGTQRLETALASGESTADVEMLLPPEAAGAARTLWKRIEEAVAFCADGEFLTLAAPDEVLHFIRWYLDEVAEQIEGASPKPWNGNGSEP
ncbi:MAG: hypothetical protein ACRDVD_02860 [Acidimicrobiia bacterium]